MATQLSGRDRSPSRWSDSGVPLELFPGGRQSVSEPRGGRASPLLGTEPGADDGGAEGVQEAVILPCCGQAGIHPGGGGLMGRYRLASPSFLGASGQGVTEMKTEGCVAFHRIVCSDLPGGVSTRKRGWCSWAGT